MELSYKKLRHKCRKLLFRLVSSHLYLYHESAFMEVKLFIVSRAVFRASLRLLSACFLELGSWSGVGWGDSQHQISTSSAQPEMTPPFRLRGLFDAGNRLAILTFSANADFCNFLSRRAGISFHLLCVHRGAEWLLRHLNWPTNSAGQNTGLAALFSAWTTCLLLRAVPRGLDYKAWNAEKQVDSWSEII